MPSTESVDRNKSSRVLHGILWMVGAAASFAVMVACVRTLSATFETVEIVFVRALVGVFLIVPMVVRSGPGVLGTRRLPLHGLRALFAFVAMLTFYYALASMEIAQAMALTFLIPVFTTIVAATVLKETVDAPRWAAVLFGFVGALVVIRPGFEAITFPILMALLSSLAYAGAWSTVKLLTRTEPAAVTVFYMNVFMLPLTLVPSLFVWVTPGWSDLPLLLLMALTGWSAHFCQARSFGAADASAVMPFDFLRLPFGALLAFALFGEVSDAWTWAGAVIIFASTYYSTWRESRGVAAKT